MMLHANPPYGHLVGAVYWVVVLTLLSLPVLTHAPMAHAQICVPTMTPEQAYLAIRGKTASIATTTTPNHPVNNAMASPINLNTATEAQLTELDGIGAKKAQDIILYRETIGAFHHVDDLSKVNGIGQATVDKNRHRITVR